MAEDTPEPFAPFGEPDGRSTTPYGALQVRLPSGAPLIVRDDDQADYVAERVAEYETSFRFTNVSDLGEVDRIITGELLIYMWGQQLVNGDYEVDHRSLQQQMKDTSAEVGQIKKRLGIDKVTRDKQRGDGSVYEYIQSLLQRAKAFGIHRNAQAARILELGNELIALVTLNGNTALVPSEQEELHVTDSDLIEWIRTFFMPEFFDLDETFRREQQTYWIRDM